MMPRPLQSHRTVSKQKMRVNRLIADDVDDDSGDGDKKV